jgi:two-component system OmpR family sensor kinase
MSDLDPDAFGILCRNLMENALRHGWDAAPVEVTLNADGWLTVTNDGPLVLLETLDRLTGRFERAGASADDTAPSLCIVAAIADHFGSQLFLKSPCPGASSGFQASLKLPITNVAATTYTNGLSL